MQVPFRIMETDIFLVVQIALEFIKMTFGIIILQLIVGRKQLVYLHQEGPDLFTLFFKIPFTLLVEEMTKVFLMRFGYLILLLRYGLKKTCCHRMEYGRAFHFNFKTTHLLVWVNTIYTNKQISISIF